MSSTSSSESSSSSASASSLRCLFIDNYDSYSYNLVHAIAASTKCAPIVRFNTESYDEIESLCSRERVACIVISPGPGSPANRDDFGVCTDIYLRSTLPILGVCLGLQGQCSTAGAKIIRAAEPRHGQLSRLAHDGKGIFNDIAQQFKVVRYNSLVVDETALPKHLEVSAWAEWDDAKESQSREIMGIRHVASSSPSPHFPSTSYPLLRESVQFHPESICTESGDRMFVNWFEMVGKWWLDRARLKDRQSEAYNELSPATQIARSIESASQIAANTTDYTVLARKLPIFVDSELVFTQLFANQPSASSFWLDSSKIESGRSRFSFMGDSSGPLSFTLSYDLTRDAKTLLRKSSRDEITELRVEQPAQIWSQIESICQERNCQVEFTDGSLPFSFESGLVGYIGYAMKELSRPESLPHLNLHFAQAPNESGPIESAADSFRPPDLAFIFADRIVVFDHDERAIYLLSLFAHTNPEASRQAASEWIQQVETKLHSIHEVSPLGMSTVTASSSASVSIDSSWSQSEPEYLHSIDSALDAIRAGESYEICMTNQLDVRVDVESPTSGEEQRSISPYSYYRILRKLNPAYYAAFFRFQYSDFSTSPAPADASSSVWCVACSSPERFLSVSRDRICESKPIKGTAARGATPEEDEQQKSRLQASSKDFAENLMIVDLLRNDLGRVCEYGSVTVPKLMDIESSATVHHLVSTVRGQLSPDKSTFDLLRSAFPPGSMTGAPKMRTCQILSLLENEPKYDLHEKNLQQQQALLVESSSSSALATSSSQPSLLAASRLFRERGIYSGSIGWLSVNGGMADLNVVIRTAVIRETKRAVAIPTSSASSNTSSSASPISTMTTIHSTSFRIGAGGAIVHLSDPNEEYAEVLLKTKALQAAIRKAAEEIGKVKIHTNI